MLINLLKSTFTFWALEPYFLNNKLKFLNIYLSWRICIVGGADISSAFHRFTTTCEPKKNALYTNNLKANWIDAVFIWVDIARSKNESWNVD